MLIGYRRGQGSIILRVKILNSSVSTGAGLTGLSSTSSGLIISTIADTESTATAYTVAASNVETITTNGTFAAPTAGKCRFKEVDSTNHKGVYEIQIADARFAVSNAKSLLVSVSGATNAAETDVVIPLRDLDPYDAVRAGLTALPNVASGQAGAIITSGTGTAQLSVSSGQVTVATNNDKTGYSLTQTFPSNFSSLAITAGGIVTANTTQLAGQTVTAAAGVTFPSSVASPTNITGGTITTVTNVTNGVTVSTNNDKSGYSLATAPPTAAAIADAVWDEPLADHLTSGSTGAGLNAAGSAGDPWSTSLPGAYGSGTAGYILGTNLNATISSRLATSGYTAPLDAAGTRSALGLAAANLDTQLDALPTATENAAAVWNALIASYTVTGSFGQRLLRSTNTQAEVQVNGNGHVASVLHSTEPDSIVVGAFAANSITASALASDAATEIATATLTTAMTESYRAAGVAPTLAQAAFELLAHMGDSAINGTTKTLKKIDGTTAKTFTLDSSTAPTSITEAT